MREMLKLPIEPFLVSQGEMINNEIEIAYIISTIAERKEDLFAIWNGDKDITIDYFKENRKEFEDLPKFIEKFDKLLEFIYIFQCNSYYAYGYLYL